MQFEIETSYIVFSPDIVILTTESELSSPPACQHNMVPPKAGGA